MFGLTQLSVVSLLALRALAQGGDTAVSVAGEATAVAGSAAQSGGNAMASATASPAGAAQADPSAAPEDGPDGNDVSAESGGSNPGWNSTYFYAPSNSKAYGFWVNGIENRAIWNAVNITSRLVLTNSRKDFWPGEKELQANIPGGVGEWKGTIDEELPTGHNYLLALYDMTSGSKLGQTSGFTMRMNGTIAPPPPPGAPGASSSASDGGAQQTGAGAGGDQQQQQSGASGQPAASSDAAAASATPGGDSAAPRLAASGAAVALAAAAYVLA